MANNSTICNDLFTSLISEIKNYNGKDHLLPWLRGIRKMKETLPPQLLRQKLPRFLQKCAQTFLTDRRYTNDLRYLRIWLQLLDFVDDPKSVLRTMEANHIGMKKALFYQAYALYYEKIKKFEAADKMYHLGVQNLAEPVDELQKSYEQFLHRIKCHENKRNQRGKTTNVLHPSTGNMSGTYYRENNENLCIPKEIQTKESLLARQSTCINAENKKTLSLSSDHGMLMKDANRVDTAENFNNTDPSCNATFNERSMGEFGCRTYSEETKEEAHNNRKFYGEDTVVVNKFVDTAIIGKSEAEDARHHGLVEPTINTKEAMNAINSMFREPLEPSLARGKSSRKQSKTDQSTENGIKVFVDENFDAKAVTSSQALREGSSMVQTDHPRSKKPLKAPLQIFIDEEDGIDELDQGIDHNIGDANISKGHFDGFVFPRPSDTPLECSKDRPSKKPSQEKFREDTVVYRFVGSTILDEPKVENVCHHGLVEPTINLKEAMDDINSMFGKPIEFARKSRPKKQEKAKNHSKSISAGFLILPDEELESHAAKSSSSLSKKESDLFEQTVCTREAMDEINKMFGMPLDF